MTESLKQIDRLICDWLKIVDDILPRLIQEMHTDTKKDRFDLVTNVDKQIQDHFQTFLSNQLPGHLLLAEEKNNDILILIMDMFGLWILLMERLTL